MTVFALIAPSGPTFIRTYDFGARTPPALAPAKDRKWVTYSETIAAVDPATEAATAPVVNVTLDGVTKTVGKRSLTAQELRDRRDSQDTAQLRQAMKDCALAVVGLGEALLAKGVIVPTDVEATTRQAFQGLKAIADRLRE